MKMELVKEQEWHKRRAFYVSSIQPFTRSYRERKGKGLSHPIYDFLFSYYTFSSTKLEKWHPGYGVVLEIKDETRAKELLENPLYQHRETGSSTIQITLSAEKLKDRERKQLSWIHSLCKSINQRTPRFACYGLHEWAMVYKSPEVRHPYPLRLCTDEIESFIDSSTIVCSHFDAFRFFTPQAAPLNILQPNADTRLAHEQGGCLHANMDLYKWAFKLLPWVSSELVRESFLLATKTREIDMRASPYDFSMLGFEPIKVETASGQAQYKDAQKEIALEASIIRDKLILQIETIWQDLGGLQIEATGLDNLPIYPSREEIPSLGKKNKMGMSHPNS